MMESGRSRARSGRSAGIQVLDRAVELLDALAASDEPVRLQALAERTGLVPSTARRILVSLCDHGLCEQTGTGSYRLGLRLFELGSRVESGFDLRRVSRAPLERLCDLTQLTVFLCVRHEDRGVAIERIDGEYAFSLALTVGGALPLHVGAAPRALLAWEPQAMMIRHVRAAQPITRYTPKTLTAVDDIIADLNESRARGYVISDEDVTPGVAALAMPVFGHADPGRPVASVSVAGLVPHVLGEPQERLVGLLAETAEHISRQLGHGVRAVPKTPRVKPPAGAA